MKRKHRKRRIRCGILFLLLSVVVIFRAFFIPWVMKPENFRDEKNQIHAFLFGDSQKDSYNAKSLILVDRSNDSIFISKKEN